MKRIAVVDDSMKRAQMRFSLAALLGMPGIGRRLRRIMRQPKPQAKLIRIMSITPGKQHAWCESNVGLIKKPLSSVPANLKEEYRRRTAVVEDGIMNTRRERRVLRLIKNRRKRLKKKLLRELIELWKEGPAIVIPNSSAVEVEILPVGSGYQPRGPRLLTSTPPSGGSNVMRPEK